MRQFLKRYRSISTTDLFLRWCKSVALKFFGCLSARIALRSAVCIKGSVFEGKASRELKMTLVSGVFEDRDQKKCPE